MFTNLASSDFLEIFILMLGSFLIGYIFAFYYFKNKLESLNSKFDIQNIDDDIEEIIDGEIGEPVLKKKPVKKTKKKD